MRVLFATAELSPVTTVGGLAAAAAGLVGELAPCGHRRRRGHARLPAASCSRRGAATDRRAGMGRRRRRCGSAPIQPSVACTSCRCRASHGRTRTCSPTAGLARQQRPLLRVQPGRRGDGATPAPPDVLHLNDWHTGAVARRRWRTPPPTRADDPQPRLPGRHRRLVAATCSDRAAATTSGGAARTRCRAASRSPTASSPCRPTTPRRSARRQGGFGLDGAAAGTAATRSIGILNGIDTDRVGPGDRPAPAGSLRRRGRAMPAARAQDRTALLDALRLGPTTTSPLATVVTRLTDQKGIDLLAPLVPLLGQIPMRLAVLGSGDAVLAPDARRRWRPSTPTRSPSSTAYDEALSHRLFAGGDVFLMPSRFEPCGLTQMQAMRYGAIPVVTRRRWARRHRARRRRRRRDGLGFVADAVEPADLVAALFRAARRARRPAAARRPPQADDGRRLVVARPRRPSTSRDVRGSSMTERLATSAPRPAATPREYVRPRWPLNRTCSSSSWRAARASACNRSPTTAPSRRCRSAARYRLIDFALSNFANAGYLKIVVLTQYKSHSLDRHISQTWRFSTLLDNYVTPVPAQMRRGPYWFQGSADAIYQNLNLIHDEKPRHRVRLRRRPHLPDGPAPDGRSTIAKPAPASPWRRSRCPSTRRVDFGVIESDDDGQIIAFHEKVADPPTMPGDDTRCLAPAWATTCSTPRR